MPRVPIYLEVRNDSTSAPVSGASVTIKKRSDGLNATVYAAETGGSPITNPVTTDSKGRALAWADPDDWNLQVTGTGVTTYTVPYDGVPKIIDGLITSPMILDGAVTDAKLTLPFGSIWTPVILPQSMSFIGAVSYTQRYWAQEGIPNNPTQDGTRAQLAVYIDPADYTFAGRTTNWRLQLVYGCNANAPTTTIAVTLVRVTATAAVASTFTYSTFVGPHITATVPAITSNAINQVATDVTGNLGGTAGLFAFQATSGAALASGSRVNVTASLLVRWT